MYESPITIVYGDIQTEFKKETKSLVVRCVQNVGVDVDKDELIKALGYDRDQYDKGYADAKAEIVHCEDCVYRMKHNDDYMCGINVLEYIRATDFCSFGERETNGKNYQHGGCREND